MSETPKALTNASAGWFEPGKRKSRQVTIARERVIVGSLVGSLTFSLLVTVAIIYVLSVETYGFFQFDDVTISEFLTSGQWNPLLGTEKHFGVWPLVSGTLLVSGVALLVAVPLGLITAIFLSEYANPKLRAVLKPALEILAGIPTVVYGFFALTIITPGLQFFLSDLGGYSALSAGIAVGILILPTISSLSEDAMRAVPQRLRDGCYGLGGTRFDAAVKVVMPAALSGIVSAVLLAMARAVGETMIVALAAGGMPRLTLDPTDEVQTMTGYMVQIALGDVSNLGVEYYSLYAVAAMLFVFTFGFAVVGAIIRRRFREAYE